MTGTPAGTSLGPNQPSVAFVKPDGREVLPVERTRVTQTTAKPESLGSLAKDKAVNSAFRAGLSGAVRATGGSTVGNAVGQTAGGLLGTLISGTGKSRDVTYVWAVEGETSPTVLASAPLTFEASPGKVVGVRPEEYVPAIVKLTPTANGWRLVGATEGKDSAPSRSVLDWPIYSSFVEERVPVDAKKLPSGDWQISAAALAPGEYALVLRPSSKDKRFAGSDVARNQGDGVLFNATWTFAIR